MSLDAIAALLGHKTLAMTIVYARIADRTVADEYFKVTEKVEALYHQPRQLPAADEGTEMRRLRGSPRALPARSAGPAAAADGGVDQPTPGVAGSRRARGGRLMTATHKFPMPTVSFHLQTPAAGRMINPIPPPPDVGMPCRSEAEPR